MRTVSIVGAAFVALCLQISAGSCAELAEEPWQQMLRDAGVSSEEYPCIAITFDALSQLILLAGCYQQEGRNAWAEPLLARARAILERKR
jgi:hypothetical protein